MRKIKRIIKITLISLLVVLIGLLITAHIFLAPKSDKAIMDRLASDNSMAYVKYNTLDNIKYRVISMQQKLDTTLPNLVFVHGSPGSALDFESYLKDSTINKKFNLFSYDRVGYGTFQEGKILGTVDQELSILHDLLDEMETENTILVGYSYGGPVVMASPKTYKYKVALAASVSASLEPQFWASKFCEWKLTRWLVPKKLRAAADEKIAHKYDLPKYENSWTDSNSPVLSIHGSEDWIVPYANSLELKELFDPNNFKLLTLEDGGHELIWSNFDFIKNELINLLP